LFFSYLWQKSLIPRGAEADETYTSSLCTSCDEAFVSLGKSRRDRCGVTLSRDAGTLNWLYFPKARFMQRVVIQCHRSGDRTLAGYMVFDIARKKPSGPGSMLLMEQCIEDKDPRVLSSLLSCAHETGKQQNVVLLSVWADSPETDAFFRKRFSLSRAVHDYRYIKFTDAAGMSSGRDNHGKVCMSLIYPPE
jgi:hypothetical protein